MRNASIQKIISSLLLLGGATMIPPALVGYFEGDSTPFVFVNSAIILIILGGVLFWPVRKSHHDIRLRDGFIVVVAAWLTVGLGGALPFIMLDSPSISVVDAIFESMSGLTTTGATVLTGLDHLPRGILYYRQQSQWLGGMGIIVLAVAILPMLRIGGMQLYRAETPGPVKDNKLTPRITETAKALWMIYLGLTVMCALAYWLGGMGLFDAIGHSFSTIAIGGFSTHDQSIGYFNSPLIESIAMIFMTLAGINFALHFLSWRRASTQPYFQDTEFRVYLILLVILSVMACATLYLSSIYSTLGESLRYGFFQVISTMTTTGYTTTDFYLWPGFLPLALIMMSFIGGCAGSTAGGMKVIRVILLFRQAIREVHHLIHPNAVVPIKLSGQKMSGKIMYAIWGFFFLYVSAFCILSLLVTASGVDPMTAFSAAGACLTNLGPALGMAGSNYAELNDFAKLLLSFAMLLGRLEIFTLLVLFTPAFWRA
jgi:trk system potassium uptake protein TrkH